MFNYFVQYYISFRIAPSHCARKHYAMTPDTTARHMVDHNSVSKIFKMQFMVETSSIKEDI